MNNKQDYTITLLGNPNVGKSTIFNNLTGLKQHTGNWPGKTVINTSGNYEFQGKKYLVYDLPGIYSLNAHSSEEVVARDFICFGNYDLAVIVCDAVCLERNLNLVLQVLEMTKKAIVCVNLMDEAKKKKIKINLKLLSKLLKVPVIGISATKKKQTKELQKIIEQSINQNEDEIIIKYPILIEKAISEIEKNINSKFNKRWISLKLLDDDYELISTLKKYEILDDKLLKKVDKMQKMLLENGISRNNLKEHIIVTINNKAHEIFKKVVTLENLDYNKKNQKIDKILTNKITGIPIMLLLLLIIFWITIIGANYPSSWLFDFLFKIEEYLRNFLNYINTPIWLKGMLLDGIYRVLAWVISVMLPPMLIFFPLFTLLEDSGILPRIAFNLDNCFRKCCACGKQALTMAMGFGCNAVGVTGCRIIDSKRERLIAILTNSMVPCNGRFPTLIAIISMFFVGNNLGIFSSLGKAFILILIILFGIIITLFISKILSKTILKGIPSSFVLELPPYRKPKIGQVLIRSVLDRSIFVLGRAACVAAPAGLIIWLMVNINIGNTNLLNFCVNLINPFANMFGLDGAILMAFILGFPANEIVLPIIIMIYMSTGQITEISNLNVLKNLLVNNDWTFITAICTMLFSLIHFPCSTTCLTIRKETKSWKWTLLSIIIPTITGLFLCFIVSNLLKIFI